MDGMVLAQGGGQPAGIGHNGGPPLTMDASMLGMTDAEQQVWAFFLNQVTRIEAEVFEIRYPEIRYPQLIPVDTTGNPWTQTVTYFSSDRVGAAQWFNANAHDVPLVGLTRAKHATIVHMAAIGYGFNEEELAIATQLGQNLSADKAAAARRAAEEFIDRVALFGDSAVGFEGLCNASGVTAATAPADGTGSATTFVSKTPDQILRDINGTLSGIWAGSSGVELADTLLLPQAAYAHVATRRLSDLGDVTVLDFIERRNIYTAETGQPLLVRGLWGLNDAGAGGTGRMIAYRRSPDVLKFHMPMPFQFRQPWRRGPLTFEVPGIFRIGGVDIRRPGSVRYLDGV